MTALGSSGILKISRVGHCACEALCGNIYSQNVLSVKKEEADKKLHTKLAPKLNRRVAQSPAYEIKELSAQEKKEDFYKRIKSELHCCIDKRAPGQIQCQ